MILTEDNNLDYKNTEMCRKRKQYLFLCICYLHSNTKIIDIFIGKNS